MAQPVFRRRFTVSFYIVEPWDDREPTWTGEYPAEQVVEQIRAMDLASGDYHVKVNLFGNELFCTVRDGPLPLLVAYTKDTWTALETEFKGEIKEHILLDGEGWLDAAYAAFFPNSVVGMVRASVKSPGTASLANWLNLFTDHPCYFAALPKADALTGLNRPGEEVLGVTFRAKKRLASLIRPVRSDVAGVIESAAQVGSSSKVEFTLGVGSRKERPPWWSNMRAAIEDLASADLLTEFDAASVSLSGRDSVNLKDAYVRTRPWVELQKDTKMRAVHAAQALAGAYSELEFATIIPSVEAWRASQGGKRQRRPRGQPGDNPKVDQSPGD